MGVRKAIFLDFDGVLFDTVKEAYAVSMIALGRYQTINMIDFNSSHYNLFRRYRYLISPAWNYNYLLKAIEYDENKVEKYYSQLILTASKNEYIKFEKLFFNTRTYLQKKDYKAWLELNTPFIFLNNLSSYINLNPNYWYIITTKDRITVEKLLNEKNIFVKRNHIFDKEDYALMHNKKSIIKNIMQSQNIVEGLFIDDSQKHLTDCQDLENLARIQPDWGYNLPEDSTYTYREVLQSLINFLGAA